MRVVLQFPWPFVCAVAVLAALGTAGCANDPVYIPGAAPLEAGFEGVEEARASLVLPIKTETAEDAAEREALAAELDPVAVPYVRIGDLEISVEWTIESRDERDGQALIQLNGANELFAYDPSTLVLDPEDDDAPEAPGLAGDVPINVPAGARVSGLFTEDDLREAAIDLDQITRGNVNPFRATLTISKNAASFQPQTFETPDAPAMPDGPAVPRAAFAGLTRIDLVFKPGAHMRLEYNVRVRDLRGILHDLLVTAEAEAPDELQPFMPMEYNPTGAPPPAP